jgi:hypothetical protein
LVVMDVAVQQKRIELTFAAQKLYENIAIKMKNWTTAIDGLGQAVDVIKRYGLPPCLST